MLHGKGNQYWMTEKYESKRKKGLKDRTKLTEQEIIDHDIEKHQGRGKTDENTYTIKQFPFPLNQTIRKRQKIDIRKVRPELGEMSD